MFGDGVNDRVRRFLPEIVVALLFAVYGLGLAAKSHGGTVEGLATLGSVAIVPAVRRSGGSWVTELKLLFAASAVIGAVSVATGLGSNATDEPFTMWGYLNLLLHGEDPYTTPAMITFTARNLWTSAPQISAPFHYVYLPLLLFFQIPGTGATGYKAMCVACWAGVVYLVRRDEVASLCLVSPMAVLVAANGFTDLPVLLLITLSLRGASGLSARAAEYATYAMKQFANAFWLVYYIARRDALRAGMVVVLTLVFAAPFIVWHPTGIWCEALTFSLSPGCASAPNSSRQVSDLYSHWNYYLWVLWVYALFHVEVHRWVGRVWRRLRPRTTGAASTP